MCVTFQFLNQQPKRVEASISSASSSYCYYSDQGDFQLSGFGIVNKWEAS